MQIAAGGEHMCAVTEDGDVLCWGSNYDGQLGNTTALDRNAPVHVAGLDGQASAVAAGLQHTCALTAAGGVKCWGHNEYGQLGNGTTEISRTPVDVAGLQSNVQAIALGMYHTCALTESGGVKCWGSNHVGQLGDGTTEDRLEPVEVTGLSSGVEAVAAGGAVTCALLEGGSVQCWGSGIGNLPVEKTGFGGVVTTISAGGAHTCVLLESGAVKCWGANYAGQLGDGTTENRTDPVDVVGLSSGVEAVAAGSQHTCALLSDGKTQCWGSNSEGQLGNGDAVSPSSAPRLRT